MKINPIAALRLEAIKSGVENELQKSPFPFSKTKAIWEIDGYIIYISNIAIFFLFLSQKSIHEQPPAAFCITLSFPTLFAQTVFLRSGSVEPPANISKKVVDSFNTTAKRIANEAFAVIQFNHIPSTSARKALAVNGIELLDYLPQNSYTVSIRVYLL
jgi:hypothetical protein